MTRTLFRTGLGLASLLLLLLSVSGCKKEGLRVQSIEPPFGNIAGNDDVVITGQGFKPGVVVQFRKRQATKIIIESDTRIRVKTPAGPEGAVDIVVTEPSGKSFVLENAFTYRKESS